MCPCLTCASSVFLWTAEQLSVEWLNPLLHQFHADGNVDCFWRTFGGFLGAWWVVLGIELSSSCMLGKRQWSLPHIFLRMYGTMLLLPLGTLSLTSSRKCSSRWLYQSLASCVFWLWLIIGRVTIFCSYRCNLLVTDRSLRLSWHVLSSLSDCGPLLGSSPWRIRPCSHILPEAVWFRTEKLWPRIDKEGGIGPSQSSAEDIGGSRASLNTKGVRHSAIQPICPLFLSPHLTATWKLKNCLKCPSIRKTVLGIAQQESIVFAGGGGARL